MMRLQMPSLMTARITTHPVPNQQRPALRLTDQPPGAAQRQHLAVLVNDGTQQRAVTGMLLRGRRLNRTHPVNVTHRLGWRSRGNVSVSRSSAGTFLAKFSADTCTTTRVRSSPERSSGAVLRKPRATSNSASALLYTPTPVRRLLGIPTWVGFGWWRPELILRRSHRRHQQRSFVLGQPGPEIDHAVLTLMPRHPAFGLLADPQTIRGPKPTRSSGPTGKRSQSTPTPPAAAHQPHRRPG